MRTVVGKLGLFAFPSGWYAYAGSARGPGGLAARVSRHECKSKLRHWHIDYLRAQAQPATVWYTLSDAKLECDWAKALRELPGASIPVRGFGASDCRCPSHLIHFSARPAISAFAGRVRNPVSQISLEGS